MTAITIAAAITTAAIIAIVRAATAAAIIIAATTRRYARRYARRGYYDRGYYDRRYYGRRGYRCGSGTTGAIVGGVGGALVGREIGRDGRRYRYGRYGRRGGSGTTGAIIGGAIGAADRPRDRPQLLTLGPHCEAGNDEAIQPQGLDSLRFARSARDPGQAGRLPTNLRIILSFVPGRVPGDLPQMAVGVLEIARIAAVEGVRGRLDDRRAGRCAPRPSPHPPRRASRHCARARIRSRSPGPRQGRCRARGSRAARARASARHASGKKATAPCSILGADDAFGRKPQAVAVESDGPFEIVDAERDQGDARFHGVASAASSPRELLELRRRMCPSLPGSPSCSCVSRSARVPVQRDGAVERLAVRPRRRG